MIRPATMMDMGCILAIAEDMAAEFYPHYRWSRERAMKSLTAIISSAKHFCWVSETDEMVDGVLIGAAVDNSWAERQSCNIMIWTSIHDGKALMQEFVAWVRSRRAIKAAGLAADIELRPAVYRLLRMMGFEQRGGAYLLYN